MDELAVHLRELDLPQGAGVQDVKSSYRKLAKVWHPDRFTHDRDLQVFANAKLAKINESYAFLLKNLESSPAPKSTTTQSSEFDFTGLKPLTKCPVCGRGVFVGGNDYLCEHTQVDTNRCGFKVGRTILNRPLEPNQLVKLVENGRTDLLNGFVSSTGNVFDAFLVLAAGGKLDFEFPTSSPDHRNPKPPSQFFREGLQHYSAGRIKDSFAAFRKAAELGDPYGHYAIGYMLSRHNGIILPWQWGDYHRTILDCWLKAAEQGIAEAEFMAGTCYACGQGTKLDKEQANKWLQKAASKGHTEAARWLKMNFLRALNSVPLLCVVPVANWFVPEPPPPAPPSSVVWR